MDKAHLISDVIESSPDDGPASALHACGGSAPRRRLRTPAEVPGQVLVTFRGVAVDENLVRYVQQRAVELGMERTGTLHARLSQARAAGPFLAVVHAGVGARRHECSARADDSSLALRMALDALASACQRAASR